MKLGLFLMPLHDPLAELAPKIREDRECVIYLDGLGYDEVFVGEHYTATSEPITDPLQFLASLAPVTKTIKLGTGVINMPQHHPLQIAGNAALLDVISDGRFLMGIGPGGLGSDMEVFGTLTRDKNAMMVEAIDIVHQLWAGEPPWDIQGEFWQIKLQKAVNTSLGHGCVIRPLQKPYPPVFTTAMSPKSSVAGTAGARGWGLISANFMPYINARMHWQTYAEGAAGAGKSADPSLWRLGRSVLCTDSDEEARSYLGRPNNSYWWYYDYFWRNLGSRGMLGIFKSSPDQPDSEITVDKMLRDIVIAGSPKTVTDRLVEIVDAVGPFGGLLVSKKDWDDPAVHKKSFALLAEQVQPKLTDYIASKMKAVA